jgi:hypothetical protein
MSRKIIVSGEGRNEFEGAISQTKVERGVKRKSPKRAKVKEASHTVNDKSEKGVWR